MALVIADSGGALVEFSAPESLNALLDSQRELLHSQIEQLRRIVVEQCKLTGTNPLAQEMAAGALSIKIGKRPRDLLNPKAAKYIQSVFSIKDTVGKKETREISAICGITVSQVREYFAGQRSRVRKLVRLSREKASKSATPKVAEECLIKSTNDVVPVCVDSPINVVELPIVDVLVTGDHPQLNSCIVTIVPAKDDQLKVASIEATKKAEEAPSSSIQEESLPGIDSEDAKFLDSIINLMRKEKTFSGQVKLMEWILKIQNSAVLSLLLSKGGISILAAWLAEAAVEEQTTVLLLIIKVLCHLPLQEALPVQMSAILQAVNKLRFYRTTDISIRAKMLLAKWSKQFIRSQARKGSIANGSKNASKDICERSISDILNDDPWQSASDIPADILGLAGKTESRRKSKQTLMLLPAPSPNSNKKNGQSVLVSKSRERRKVLLVEHPDRKASGRSVPVARAVPLNSGRPISADDIQKAKMRAIFMQNKHGKSDPSTGGNKTHDAEIRKVPCAPQTNNACTTAKSPLVTQEVNRDDKTLAFEAETTAAAALKQTLASKGDVFEKLRCSQIRWRTPPAVRIDPQWCMGVGQNSKEIQVQTQRNQREKETLYSDLQKIPPDPKEPWDREMDFDDSLTPEIPTEQPPDGDVAENLSLSMPESGANTDEPSASTLVPPSTGNGVPEPDLELLAVLLKNPDLVFALTSNQASQLKNEDTVALLDLLKRNDNSLTELLNASEQSRNNVSQELKRQEPEPTSLPSPTPSSDVARVTAWRSVIPTRTSTPVLQPHFQISDSLSSLSHGMPVAGPALPEVDKSWGAGAALHERSSTVSSLSQVTTVNPLRQNSLATSFLPNRSPTPTIPHPTFSTSQLMQQQTASDINLPIRQYSAANTRVPNPLLQQDSFSHSPLPVPSLAKRSHLTEQLAFTHMNNKRPAGAANSTGGAWPDAKLDEWTGRNSDLLDAGASNQHHLSHPNRHLSSESGYDSYSRLTAHPSQPPRTSMVETGYRNVVVNRSDMESWSLDGSPMRSSQLRAGRSYNNEPQRNGVWSRQWASGNQNAHWPGSGNRWPDCDRHRDNRGRR